MTPLSARRSSAPARLGNVSASAAGPDPRGSRRAVVVDQSSPRLAALVTAPAQPAGMVSIPDRYVFLWSGRRFPYHARLAIESVLVAEPGATIHLATFDEPPAGPHLDAIAARRAVRVAALDPAALFRGLDAPASRYLALLERLPRAARSARSNLLRLGVLHRDGGVYLDLDILMIRGLADLRAAGRPFVGAERVWRHDEARVRGELGPRGALTGATFAAVWAGHQLRAPVLAPAWPAAWLDLLHPLWSELAINNAVIGAPAGHPLIARALAAALEVDPTVRYALGPSLLTRVVRASADDVAVQPPEAFYPVPPSQSFRLFREPGLALAPETRLVHWVASNHRALERAEPAELLAGRGLFHRLAGRAVAELAAQGART
jgi:hypothetical protein